MEGQEGRRGEDIDAGRRQDHVEVLHRPFFGQGAGAVHDVAPLSIAIPVEPKVGEGFGGRRARIHRHGEGDGGGGAMRQGRAGVGAIIALVLIRQIGKRGDVVDDIGIPPHVGVDLGADARPQVVTVGAIDMLGAIGRRTGREDGGVLGQHARWPAFGIGRHRRGSEAIGRIRGVAQVGLGLLDHDGVPRPRQPEQAAGNDGGLRRHPGRRRRL